MAYWFGFAAVAGAFGGLIAFGIQHASNISVAHWQLLFIVEVRPLRLLTSLIFERTAKGVPTVLLGLLTIIILPNRPEATKIFTDRERQIALVRMNRSTTGDVGHTINKGDFFT